MPVLPPGLREQASSRAPPPLPKKASPSPSSRIPLLRLEIRDLSHAGAKAFLSALDASTALSEAVQSVLALLYGGGGGGGEGPSTTTTTTTTSSSSSASPGDDDGDDEAAKAVRAGTTTATAPPPVRSITLVLRAMDGVAYTTGIELDSQHKEIHLSTRYVASIMPAARQRDEILGVLRHEMVHCFQWDGRGQAPGGLIEGVADWVRLRSGLVPPHWRRVRGGRWDQGYQATGYFLDWIEGRFGAGSVRRVNGGLRGEYVEGMFWEALFGVGVGELWEMYGESLEEERRASENEEKENKNECKTETPTEQRVPETPSTVGGPTPRSSQESQRDFVDLTRSTTMPDEEVLKLT